jgi:uncharacterized protein (DUF2141 family)
MRLPSYPRARVNLARIILRSSWLILMNPGVFAAEEPACPGIHVTVLGIRNSVGTVDCALFDAPKGFPADVLHSAMRVMVMKVPSSEARCDFEGIPPGTYALVVLHDENMNGKVDTNWIGIPKEGYGFSNDAKASFSAPSFKDASFLYNGEMLEMTISLHY